MSFTPISNDFIQYQAQASGTSAAGYFLKLYAAGTTTPISTALDSAGGTLVAKVELDSLGFAQNGSGGATTLYIDQAYRLVLYVNTADADANTFGNAVQDIDDIPQIATLTGSGETVKNFATLAAAVADTNLLDGDTLITGDRVGATWDVVLSSTVTENTFNIVQGVGVGTLSLVLRVGSIANVEQFGATGDGSTDDSVPVQAAMDAGTKDVYLPTGNYLIEGVTVSSDTRVYGPGIIKSILGTSSPDADVFSKNSILASGVSNITFDGITFDGGIVGEIAGSEFSADDPDNLESPLDIQNCTDVTLTGCKFTNISTQATALGTRNQRAKKGVAYILGCTKVLVEKCTLGPNVFIEGFVILDTSDVTIDKNYALLTDDNKRISSPVVVTGADIEKVHITNNIFIGHGGSCMNLWGASGFHVSGNTIEGRGIDFSNEGGYTITESPRDINITNNTIDFTGTSTYVSTSVNYGVFVQGTATFKAKNVVIDGNIITSATQALFMDHCDGAVAANNKVINPRGVLGGQGLGISATDSSNVQILGNYVNGNSTVEFGVGVSCIYTQDSNDVLIKDNILDEAETYLLYINNGNGRVRAEGNIFKYSTTTPTRNVFGSATGATNLILKNNQFPLLSSSVDYNTTFSSSDYVSFEDDQIIEIGNNVAFTFSAPVSHYFVEVSTSANGNAGCLAHNDAALVEIYAGTDAIVTTGVLSGSTGANNKLNLSAVGDTLYVENRLGTTEFFRIKIRG